MSETCRKFPVAEQKRPTLATYPGSTVSFVVQMNAWKATHLDKDLESQSFFSIHCEELISHQLSLMTQGCKV